MGKHCLLVFTGEPSGILNGGAKWITSIHIMGVYLGFIGCDLLPSLSPSDSWPLRARTTAIVLRPMAPRTEFLSNLDVEQEKRALLWA